MIFKLIKAGVAALALLAVPFAAQAADMPIKAPYYKGAPDRSCPTTTGPASTPASTPATAWAPRPGRYARRPTSSPRASGRRHARLQLAGRRIVYGLEGDFDWSDVKGSVACAAGVTCETSKHLARHLPRPGRLRLRSLAAVHHRRRRLRQRQGDRQRPDRGLSASASSSQLGWTIGAGLEYAFLGNWTAKLEYLYVDLGSFDAGPAPVVNNVSFKENIVRAGLNYKFSGPIFSRF